MKVLVIGSGGREHSLVWKLRQSPRISHIFCAPGNAGIAGDAECVAIPANEIEALARFAATEKIDLTIVGPEEPLTLGIVDLFQDRGLRIFGPGRQAARLEGSKVFMKDLLARHGIPSGFYGVFTDRDSAVAYIHEKGIPIVIKADGLAAGKGVIVAQSMEEALAAVDTIITRKAFGSAGDRIVIEEYLPGEEASFLAFTDGKTVIPLPSSQDHKAVFDGDKGPNTGGMGAYSPAPVVTAALHDQVMEKIMYPTVRAMAQEGCPYKGVLYAGLMIQNDVARVLEFNCRFGDPECQPLLMRLNSDLVEVMSAVIDGDLAAITLDIDPQPAVCVVMAAGGYPGSYEKGKQIKGLNAVDADPGLMVFHAGTMAAAAGAIVTAGGRVLGVTAKAPSLEAAITKAYGCVTRISWEGCQYRRDIGQKALRREVGAAGRSRAFPGARDTSSVQSVVGIVMGSDSDLPVMTGALSVFRELAIPCEITVASAHRSPRRAMDYAETAMARGLKVIIAGAGMAAHLAGVLAAHTTLPVIGVPIDSSSLRGMDALLATVQMPSGIPVATMAIGKTGATNAAILVAQILALGDMELALKLIAMKERMAAEVEEKAARLQEKLAINY